MILCIIYVGIFAREIRKITTYAVNLNKFASVGCQHSTYSLIGTAGTAIPWNVSAMILTPV